MRGGVAPACCFVLVNAFGHAGCFLVHARGSPSQPPWPRSQGLDCQPHATTTTTPRLQIAPTVEEVKALGMYRGPVEELSPPERFLLVMSRVPRLVDKVGGCRGGRSEGVMGRKGSAMLCSRATSLCTCSVKGSLP